MREVVRRRRRTVFLRPGIGGPVASVTAAIAMAWSCTSPDRVYAPDEELGGTGGMDADGGTSGTTKGGSSGSASGGKASGGSAGTDGGESSGGTGQGGSGKGGKGTSGSGGSPDGGTGGGNPDCPATHRCVAAAPTDWEGPALIASTSQFVTCPEGWPESLLDVHQNLTATPAQCTCNCGTPSVTCSQNMGAVGFSDTACANGQGANNITANTCYQKLTTSGSHGIQLSNASASCATGTVGRTVPTASWSVNDRLCGTAPEGGTCDDAGDRCLPDPANFPVCIFRGGDVACPTDYPEKTVYYTAIADTRSCPMNCSCTASGHNCRVSVTGYSTTSCTSAVRTVNVISGTTGCVIYGTAMSMRPGTPVLNATGMCNPGAANPTGSATPSDPTTVCCTP